MKFQLLVIRFLIDILGLLLDLKGCATGSVYSWESERKLINDAKDFVRNY